jgi:hypothetical protein
VENGRRHRVNLFTRCRRVSRRYTASTRHAAASRCRRCGDASAH